MRKFIALISVIFVLGLAISAGKPVDATYSDPTARQNEAVILRAKRQLEEAAKDPEKSAVLRCLGANVAPQPSESGSNDAQCEIILAAAAGKNPNQQIPILKGGGVNGSPAARAYIQTMVRFQLNFETAYHAGICRLRSESYFNTFQIAQLRLSQQEARRQKLSETEMARASAEVNRQVADLHRGLPDFDIIRGCDFLRNSTSMDEVDALYRRLITSGY